MFRWRNTSSGFNDVALLIVPVTVTAKKNHGSSVSTVTKLRSGRSDKANFILEDTQIHASSLHQDRFWGPIKFVSNAHTGHLRVGVGKAA
jgi:hypothetical protein